MDVCSTEQVQPVAELFLVFFLDFNAGVTIHSFLEDYRLIAS